MALLAAISGAYALGCSGPDGDGAPPMPPSVLPGGAGTGGSGSATGSGNMQGTGGRAGEVTPGMLATGGTGALAPAAGAGGSAALGTPVGDCLPGAPPFTCGGMAAPPTGLLVDFATYITNRSLATFGNWGNNTASNQLTGGSSFYQGTPESALAASVEAGALRLQANVPPQGYTGIVLWLGPCVDASVYSGLEFLMGGTLNGATLEFRVQTNENYPVSVASTNKGACPYTSCDSRFSTECLFANVQIPAAMVPATPAAMSLSWSMFGNGKPVATLSPNQLVGLQLHFQCPADVACIIDLSLGTINFSAATL